ncbi:uncharacterized protein LOC115875478 [Sitophilus oryzae]|uniref:Uncharacterized protein LOC115875478 n=1 Tax=Sitophilus oryzae TaxID=7048 RepID=A0A6J2X6K6_SITOR|nr:uncharacterized protein LOC115875478 [Sitophilus oryzae]
MNPEEAITKQEETLQKNKEECESSIIEKVEVEQNQKIMHRIEMDDVLEKIEVPFKKIQENLYLLAVDCKEDIEKTVEKIQNITRVTWSVKQTRKFEARSNRTLTLFKRLYGCHMATRRRVKTKNIKRKKSRNIDCPAQLIVTIRRFISNTKSKNRESLLDKKFPCSFEFRNDHNHPLDTVEILKARPVGDETKQAILDLLNKGHSCASAYHTYYVIKAEEFGPDYKDKMTDRYYFPKRNDISTLWKMNNFKEKNEKQNGDYTHTIRNLEDILNSYQKKNGTLYRISVINDSYVVCICTPLMQRAVQQISEILFIDSSSSEVKEHKIYFILTQSSVGAFPISCIITNSHNTDMFSEGMRLFFDMINIQPSIVLTSAEIVEEIILQKFFPSSKVIYSFYHTLKSCWRFLHDIRHELAKGKKESYYQLFREVVFSDNEESLVVSRQVLAVECTQPKFLNFIDTMYESTNLWCLFYRQFILLRGTDTFNYNEAEISFRLFRLLSEIPLDRTKHFNATQMVDFMCCAFEKYYRNRILEIVLCKESRQLKEWYIKKPPLDDLQMQDIGHHQYLFKSVRRDSPEAYYQVDMITNICTCSYGILGKTCEHASEVIIRCNIFMPLLSVEQKAAYYFVATGILKHKNSFLPSQEDCGDEEYNIISCSPKRNIEMETSANVDPSFEACSNYESTKNKWIAYCNQVLQHMEKDPGKFLPAINAHLENVQKYSTSIPLLLKGLYAGFPYKGDAEKLPPLTIINKTNIVDKCSVKTFLNKPGTDTSHNNAKNHQSSTVIKQLDQDACDKPTSIPIDQIPLTESSWGNIKNPSETTQEISIHDNATVNIKNTDEILENKPIIFSEDDPQSIGLTIDTNRIVKTENDSLFDVPKEIYVDQSTLDELSQCEMAVLDEKKGILIIPLSH